MNLFHLDLDPVLAAQANADKHVIKIALECAQLLSSAYPKEIAPYKITHKNHPMSIWVRESFENFQWAANHGKALCQEYTFRYGKTHASERVIDWCLNNKPELPSLGLTKVPRCFGEFKGIITETDSHVNDYRQYYLLAKKHLFNWKNRQQPDWIK